MIGKRFIFAGISMVLISVTSIMLKFDGEIYWKLVSSVVGVFLASQTITDYKKGG